MHKLSIFKNPQSNYFPDEIIIEHMLNVYLKCQAEHLVKVLKWTSDTKRFVYSKSSIL